MQKYQKKPHRNKIKKKDQAPINLSKADVIRANEKVEEFKRLVERGKTPEDLFKDLCRLIEIDE